MSEATEVAGAVVETAGEISRSFVPLIAATVAGVGVFSVGLALIFGRGGNKTSEKVTKAEDHKKVARQMEKKLAALMTTLEVSRERAIEILNASIVDKPKAA